MSFFSLQDIFLGEPGEVYYFQHMIWAYAFTMTHGAAYTGQEISVWMQEAGFISVRVKPLLGYSWLNAIILGEKPRYS